jgi:hypothetical protein
MEAETGIGGHRMLLVRVGKARDCNECSGDGTVFLYATPNGLWSHCLSCGFSEWEWSYGDSIEYLSYLAERFRVSEEEIIRALEEVKVG